MAKKQKAGGVYAWQINAKRKVPLAGFGDVPMMTALDAPDEETARRLFEERNGEYRITTIKRGRRRLESYEDLVVWLRQNNVSPEEARFGVQVHCINGRPENRKPWPCPKCRFNLADDIDKVGNGYYCPKCGELIQVG